jgi:D-aminoacyl-tRNA deacylase
MKAIVCSSKDVASRNIYDLLKREHGFVQSTDFFDDNYVYKKGKNHLVLSDKDPIFINPDSLDAELLIFASKHKSGSGYPTLTVHSTGIFSDDISHGGTPYQLSHINARANGFALRKLKELNNTDFAVSLEVTHHGPVTRHPMVFVEVGSSLKQWNMIGVCNIVAKTCVSLLDFNGKSSAVSAVGFGGSHYAPKFSDRVFGGEYDIGHICPKYSVKFLTFDLVKQMVERTAPLPKVGLIDRKSCARKTEIKSWVVDLGVEPILI